MSEGNGDGIIRIGRKGKQKFCFGDSPAFEVDIIHVANQWAQVDRSFRDEKGVIVADTLSKFNEAALEFVKQIAAQPDLTLSEALEFLKHITLEGEKLRLFFDPKPADGSFSGKNAELVFATD